MTTSSVNLTEATVTMIMRKHHISRPEAEKYVQKALDGGFGEYTQKLMKGACGVN